MLLCFAVSNCVIRGSAADLTVAIVFLVWICGGCGEGGGGGEGVVRSAHPAMGRCHVGLPYTVNIDVYIIVCRRLCGDWWCVFENYYLVVLLIRNTCLVINSRRLWSVVGLYSVNRGVVSVGV